MLTVATSVLLALGPTEKPGFFEDSKNYLVRVSTVEVPDNPDRVGYSKVVIRDVLIGPAKLKGKEFWCFYNVQPSFSNLHQARTGDAA